MGNIAKKLDLDLSLLSPEEKAALAHDLIEELDGEADLNSEEIWREEAERRYREFKLGQLSTDAGSDVFERARNKLAQ